MAKLERTVHRNRNNIVTEEVTKLAIICNYYVIVLCDDKKEYNYSLRFNCTNQEKIVNQLCYVYHMYMNA